MADAPGPVTEAPCHGLSVVEVAVGASELGLGMAGGVPGMLLGQLGATVTRVVGPAAPGIDAEVAWGRGWHRGKRIVVAESAGEIRSLLAAADVAFVYGCSDLVEARGLGREAALADNPRLVYARCGPSRTSAGTVEDYALLVEARAGFCTQLEGNRPGPILVDVRAATSGAAFVLVASALALLARRERTGAGGWSETSLYDGMLTTLGCMIGRSERAPRHIEDYWRLGSTFPNFLYRCADGELIQVWFGGKGMYSALLEVLGDEPSPKGYYDDQVTGALNERARRWESLFAAQPRDVWVERILRAGVACEPCLAPGEVLADPHLAQCGIAVAEESGDHRDVVVASPLGVRPLRGAGREGRPAPVDPARERAAVPRLLDGLRVLDFSAYVAGPLAGQVLADMGAEVIKVEPLEGEAMRAAAYAVAACQRGKRSLALDLRASGARPIVERLIGWADVVLHNFRPGVAERLGIGEEDVASIRPDALYCHASAFGLTGPRAEHPGNDALMQALTGMERAVGGAGNEPVAATWIPIDMAGGWVMATGILAGLYARARSGRGQFVESSLLGAGMLLQSNVFTRDGVPVRRPQLDFAQTGYGPGYRIYECAGGEWLALVVPDADAWQRLRSLPELSGLPATYTPLSGGAAGGTDGGTDTGARRGADRGAVARRAEEILERAFGATTAAEWSDRLRPLGALAEVVVPMDRDTFRRGVLDDPVNRALGRVVSFETAEWGHFEHVGPLVRCGPDAEEGPALMLPGVGEHSAEVLGELGFSTEEVADFVDAGLVALGGAGAAT